MTEHTPGPWRVGAAGPNGCLTVGTERGLMTAMVAHSINSPNQEKQARADASLIAAAPDLLAAAEGVLPWLAGINTKGDPAMVDALTDVYMQLAAAIKKAKGQQ